MRAAEGRKVDWVSRIDGCVLVAVEDDEGLVQYACDFDPILCY